VFTVGVHGRVTRCTVTRSSGVPELDALTCRLVQQRFVYRPATDRYGRPVSDDVEGEQEWIPTRRY
jgi:protein TonB